MYFWFRTISLLSIATIFPVIGDDNYFISHFKIEYLNEHPKLPSYEKLKEILVELGISDEGFVLPQLGKRKITLKFGELLKARKKMRFSQTALQAVCRAIVESFQQWDVGGVNVYVKDNQIGPEGEDIRPFSKDWLDIVISALPVGEVRLLAKEDQPVSASGRKILENCPVKEGDLLAPEVLENYIFFLNRFPNRQVEVIVGGVNRPQVVGLDFIITEDKPWRVYANVANIGPEGLNRWQEVIGYVNTQVTGNDDVLQINIGTDSFNRYNSGLFSYEAPFPHMPRLRYEVIGSYSQFSSAQLGLMSKEFVGKQAIASLSVDWNGFQNKDFFFDLIGGLEYRYIHVDNRLFNIKGHANFLLPILGIELSRFRNASRFFLEMDIETPVNSVSTAELNKLGRFDVSKNWFLFTENGYVSFFLEPLFSSKTTMLANEIFLGLYSQYAGNLRLIPEFQGTVGGLYSVRGYPTAITAGDNTITYNLEYLLHVPRLFPSHRSTECPGTKSWDFILRGFFDGARAVNNRSRHHNFGETNATLMGTGVGAAYVFRQNIFLRNDYGWALSQVDGIHKGHLEVYFSATLMY